MVTRGARRPWWQISWWLVSSCLVALIGSLGAVALGPALPARAAAKAAAAPGFACAAAPTDPGSGASIIIGTGVGAVKASVTFTGTTFYGLSAWSHPELTITDGGADVFTGPLAPAPGSLQGIFEPGELTGYSGPFQPLCAIAFARATSPVVAVGLYTGGAHCCFMAELYSPTKGTMDWKPTLVDFGNAGVHIETFKGAPVMVTSDNAFAYTFAAFAFSALPIEIDTLTNHKVVDVRTQYPRAIAADAKQWWKAVTANGFDTLGVLAAWVADECLLGHHASAYAQVAKLQTEHKLKGVQGWPSGASYVRTLKKFLVKQHYCPST